MQRVPLDYASVRKPGWRLDVPRAFLVRQGVSLGLGLLVLGIARSDTIFAFFVVPVAALFSLLQVGLATIPGWVVLLGKSELPPWGRLVGCVAVALGPVLSGLAVHYGMNWDFCC